MQAAGKSPPHVNIKFVISFSGFFPLIDANPAYELLPEYIKGENRKRRLKTRKSTVKSTENLKADI